ncbi:hypothetical protein CBM2599_B50346 [Cupriavidus taiwanensis]|nr:hypothetical protein CBM2600_B10646 [Cupriavidus taiwanensis]SOY96414.1 hypothetical protein CBM2599_B50346 [Cupriavidus taiwanensis]
MGLGKLSPTFANLASGCMESSHENGGVHVAAGTNYSDRLAFEISFAPQNRRQRCCAGGLEHEFQVAKGNSHCIQNFIVGDTEPNRLTLPKNLGGARASHRSTQSIHNRR